MPASQQQQSRSLYAASGRRKYLTETERMRFLQAARDCPRGDLRTLCLFLAHIGCRVSEALAMTPRAVEFESGFVALRSLKKRKLAATIREVPAPPELLDELRKTQCCDQVDADHRIWPMSRSQAWRLIKMVMKSAGIRRWPASQPERTAPRFRRSCDPFRRPTQSRATLVGPCAHGNDRHLPSSHGRRRTPDRGAHVVEGGRAWS